MIHYQIKAINPNAHLFEVTLTISSPTPSGQVCHLPNWIPGSYMIRDFAKHLQWISAEGNGKKIPYKQLDKSTWEFEPCDGELIITYQVYAWDLSVRGAHLDQTHGFFNGTSVFLAVKGQEESVHQVEIIKPDGEQFKNWRVATGLEITGGTKEFQFGVYQANSYDELIDCPVEMADFEVINFDACGVPHHMVLTGRFGKLDSERLKNDLIKICEHHIRFFAEPAPMNRYVFMTYVLGNGFGGLEHRNSTALHCSREDLPLLFDNPDKVKKNYQTFLDLCSHEYFHTWNIKRIKPSAFVPYVTEQESYTDLLWAFEGITSYYDSLACVQAGVISPENYLTALAKTITSVRRSKGRLIQSVTDSSFNAWTKYYKQDENAPNAVISYYTKGALIAFCLDFLIRQKTAHKQTLQDVMQYLWFNFGAKGIGIENDTIQNYVLELCGAENQKGIMEFFDKALYSTEELDLETPLAALGLKLNYQARTKKTDRGGFSEEFKAAKTKVGLGIEYTSAALGIKVKNVYLNSSASDSGISAGDQLISFHGLKINSSNIEQNLSMMQAGETVEILGFRRDELMKYNLKLAKAEDDTAYISYSNGSPNELLKSWLNIDS
ncbi:M61 family metallopeptidase [Kangiella sp. HZ709]|uniref:M61 family metallopeptidase n=1 Tax=Kangiella sp. HZ709 TaxID=2666328 RepID=UPI0012B150F5|nr:PDZ domain-containing protein [Kangiella sp. HZ709]MRX26528.1 PDZ domain-containing protein [Kangiella sp. HZ709]